MKRVDVYCFGGIMEAILVGWDELQGKDVRDAHLRFKDPEIDKTAVKNAILKDGEVIEGAEVVQTEGLQIR